MHPAELEGEDKGGGFPAFIEQWQNQQPLIIDLAPKHQFVIIDTKYCFDELHPPQPRSGGKQHWFSNVSITSELDN